MKQKKNNNVGFTRNAGFTLAEVTIAIVIMGLGFGAIFNLNTIISLSTRRAMERVQQTTHADYVFFQGRAAYSKQTNNSKETSKPAEQKEFSTKIKLTDIDQEATYKRTPVGKDSSLGVYELVREQVIFANGALYTTFSSPTMLQNPIEKKEEKADTKNTAAQPAATGRGAKP